MSRNIRTNFLTDKSTFGNSTMPIGSIVPIFKAISEKVTDNGVVVNLGAVVGGVGGGSGYFTDLATVSGYPTAPIDVEFQSGVSLTIGTDIVNIPNHPFIEGDKLTVISTDQAPDRAKFGGSIESFTIGGGGGSNYTSAPLVHVTDNGSGPITSGSFAAEIDVSTGKVTGINVIDGGTGYQFPVATLIGGGGTGATAIPLLATGGVGGISFDRGFVFYVDVVDANNIRLARSNADLGAGKYYNITTIGSNGIIRVASSTGFGLRVGVSAEDDGTLEFCTPVKAGYGYADGDVVYILQPGSSGTGRIEIVTTTSPTVSQPDVQYEGWLYCDGSEYDADMFPLLYQVIENKYGGLGAAYDPSNFGQSSGGITFNVPDYKARKLVGAGGGVSGGGSPVSGNVISTVGATGGRWFFSKTQQEALFDIGNIVISGYPNITEFVGGTLTGEVTIRIGPLEDKMITSVPEHDHALMTSSAPQAGAFEGSSFAVDTHLASYKDTTGQVSFFLPSNGSPLFHSHGVVDYIITDPTLSTFGNTSGIGETIDVTITATNIIGETGGTKFNIPGHDLATGYKIRVKSNDQTTQCTFDVDGVNVAFSTNSEWYVIVIDDDNFYLAKTKYKAKIGDALFATTNGNAGSDIVIELLYKMAGNLPGDTVTVIQQPSDTVWDIDNGYTIGGKTIVNPGGESTKTVTITESNVAGSYTVPAPTAEQSPIVGVSGFLGGAGGGGATTDVSGTNGGDSYYEFNYNGNQIQIVSESGEGGTQGDSGGNGGSGGQCRIVSGGTGATNVNSTGTYTVGGLDIEIQQYYPGNDGVNGSSSAGGEGGVAALIGGAGGDGSRTLFTGTQDVTQTFNTPDSGFVIYNVPQTWPIQQLRATLRGGGGGSGGTGDGGGGWHAGDGGPGKRMTVNLSNPDDIVSLRVYVGGGGTSVVNGAPITYLQNVTDGLHFRVRHSNHGMYSREDQVTLSGVEGDVKPEKLTSTVDSSSTEDMTVTAVGIFTSFENVPVSSSNPGYIKINNEIIKYTGVTTTTSTINNITRSIDNTKAGDYEVNDKIFKYELNGVSLRRINASHSFLPTNDTKYPIDVDHYWIKVGVSSRGIDRATGNASGFPELFFSENKSGGSYDQQYVQVGNAYGPMATQNIAFNIVRPNVATLLPEGTEISAKIRTFSGNSPDGNLTAFVDQGYEDISLNTNNYLTTPRIVASKSNELEKLIDFPGRKSFTLQTTLTTDEPKVSPMIDLDRVNMITIMDRLNSKVTDYAADRRVNSVDQDPSAAIYLSKVVNLEKASDGLKVQFDAYRHSTNDIRVMYRIFRIDAPPQYQLFELFPGFENLDSNGNVIDASKNNGKPDRRILSSSTEADYKEYEFNAKNLPQFNGFQIKIVMTGTNFAYVPKIRDLRAIASI